VAVAGVDALYPAFDITPPHLITGIVTDRGIFPAPLIGRYSGT
jgi:methylthioribose-1-phosphate isomerase